MQQHLGVTLLAVGIAPAQWNPSGAEFVCHLPVRHAVLLAAEGVFVRIQQHAHRHAARVGGFQCVDQAAMGEIEHRDIECFTGCGGLDGIHQGAPDGTFGQHAQTRAGFDTDVVCGGKCSKGLVGKCRHGGFGMQHVQRGGTGKPQCDVAVRSAGIVRIGRGHQRLPTLAGIHYQRLAMIGAEVRQREPTAQGDFFRAERVGQPAAGSVVAKPAATQRPRPGPERVGGAQCGKIGQHHLCTGPLQHFQMG